MISSVSQKVGDGTRQFKFGARAMSALEDHYDKGVIEIVEGFQQDAEAGTLRIGTLIRLIAECADDGDGVDDAEAHRLFDALGAFGAAELLGKCIDKAFPEAKAQSDKGTTGKNGKRAARSK